MLTNEYLKRDLHDVVFEGSELFGALGMGEELRSGVCLKHLCSFSLLGFQHLFFLLLHHSLDGVLVVLCTLHLFLARAAVDAESDDNCANQDGSH